MRHAWLNPAGGLRYHLRALRAGRDWDPFRGALACWLSTFDAPATHAVLVGPSAGYTFPDAFLGRYSAITVLEPDPIAGRLLCRRLRALGVVSVRLESVDRLIKPLLNGGDGLAELLRADPGACLIFGNVLGQARFLVHEPDFERFKQAFRERILPLLAQRSWLSFHDRLSGAFAPNFQQPYVAASRLPDSVILRELYPSAPDDRRIELFDHQSDGFFPTELPHTYFYWPIDRARHHLIEGVMSVPSRVPREAPPTGGNSA